ncbi:type IV secretory system conjugative DNA transfer family protein [Mycobacteroides abscessus]|uniref:type IV secretory system conjugative DNA transfer family protein n=1 Tax=Mycobacteroides abscessus TaxID=36809 RepID=UPI000C260672|nr:type IV secretory system conjugative DNA transfer family protein [Mycobacteroides abscessus]
MTETPFREPRQVLHLTAAHQDTRWQDEEGAEYWHSPHGWQHESPDPNHEPYKPHIYTEILDTPCLQFPVVVTPPVPQLPIARTSADAISLYDEFTFSIGVDQAGKRLEYSPKLYPHLLIVGSSGAGKTVFIHGLIEPYRAAGFSIFICDVRGTEYTAYTDLVTAVSSETPEHVRLMHALREELDRRRRLARERKLAGDSNPTAFEPWLMVFDDYSNEIAFDYAYNGSDQQFLQDLLNLATLAREYRIHLIVSSQNVYPDTLPQSLIDNLGLVIALGRPDKLTLEKVFPHHLKEPARQITRAMPSGIRGRGIVGDLGVGTVTEFQAYHGYHPGAVIEDQTPEVQSAWTHYRDNVSDQIQRLHPRQWFKIESAADLHKPIAALHNIPMVNLDLTSGAPDPDALQYDKQRPEYNGYKNSGSDR